MLERVAFVRFKEEMVNFPNAWGYCEGGEVERLEKVLEGELQSRFIVVDSRFVNLDLVESVRIRPLEYFLETRRYQNWLAEKREEREVVSEEG